MVAKYLSGEVIIGSGAYKFSNKNLVGDVDVRVHGHEYLKLEVKTTGATRKKGMFYTMQASVLQQMQAEAERFSQKGALWLHFKHSNPMHDFVFFPRYHHLEFMYDAGILSPQHVVLNTISGGKSTTLYQTDLDLLFHVAVDIDKFPMVLYTVDSTEYIIMRGGDVQNILQRVRDKEVIYV